MSVQLCAADEATLTQWAAAGGVPDDHGTRQFVADHLLLKLWAAHQELAACVGELTGLQGGLEAAVTELLSAIAAEQPGFDWTAERTADAVDVLTKLVLPVVRVDATEGTTP